MNGLKNNLSILLQHWPYDKRCWKIGRTCKDYDDIIAALKKKKYIDKELNPTDRFCRNKIIKLKAGS